MIGGIKDWIIGILLVVALAAGWKAYHSHQKAAGALQKVEVMSTQLAIITGSLEAVIEDRSRRDELARKRQALTERKLKDAQRQHKELTDALKDNPGWADQPVPDGVWRSLGPSADHSDPEAAAPGGVAGRLSSPAKADNADQRGAGPVAERIRGGPGGLQH